MKKPKTIFIERYMEDQKFHGWSQANIIETKNIHKHGVCCQPIIKTNQQIYQPEG